MDIVSPDPYLNVLNGIQRNSFPLDKNLKNVDRLGTSQAKKRIEQKMREEEK